MPDSLPTITFTMENGDHFKAELYPEQAPNTVTNFIALTNKKYYDGLIFHRVIPGFMIQGGCPEGTGSGGPGYSVRAEFLRDPGDPSSILAHKRGMLSMARSAQPDSAGSQFFVMVADSSHLDGQYTSFGQVIEGMEVVDAIVGQARDHGDRPNAEQRIQSVVADTHGKTYPKPETI